MDDGYNEITSMTKSFPGAYRIVCNIGVVRYVGSSKNVKRRVQEHISMLLRGKHDCKLLQEFYEQNSKRPFKYYAKEATDRERAFDLEQVELDRWFQYGHLCNVAENARKSGEGMKQSEETKQKRANSNRGKKRSKETRAKQSEAQKGKTHSLITRQKLSEINKGNKNALGYKHTPEALLKMSEANKGKTVKHSDTTKRKIGDGHRGKVILEKSKVKFRQTMEDKKANGFIDSKSIAVSIDDVVYPNLRKASEATGLGRRTIHSRCLSKNFTNYFQIK